MKYEKIFFSLIFPINLLISVLFFYHGFNEALTIIMILPALAAVISILIEFKSSKELLKPFFQKISIKSLVFAILFPFTIIMLCMFLTLLTKKGALLTSWNNVFINIESIMFISVIFFITGLFEEYAWRGYLLPRFMARYSLKKTNNIIGIIIAVYHLPIIFIFNLHYGIVKALTFTLIQFLAIFAMNYAFTYLFTLSENVILPSIMRSFWNNLNLAVLGYSYKLLPSFGYISGKPHLINGEGLFGLIFLSIFALYISRKFSKV